MGRPRKRDKGLPSYVRILNGSYIYRGKKLCRVDEGESRMYELLAERKALPSVVLVQAAIAKYKGRGLRHLSALVRTETCRYLDIFADDFAG